MGYTYSLAISAIGHALFALGIQWKVKGLMFFGKALSGSMYEILDALMPILYLGTLYREDFQLVVGFMQMFIRMGSVVNFIVTPFLYRRYGLNVAMWVASLVGMSGLLLFLMARFIELNLYTVHPNYVVPRTTGEDDSNSIAELYCGIMEPISTKNISILPWQENFFFFFMMFEGVVQVIMMAHVQVFLQMVW